MAEVLEKPKLEEKPRAVGMAAPQRVQTAEHGRNVHLFTAENGEHPEDFLRDDFWGLVSMQKGFQPYDHIEIRTDDGTFWGEYLILACDRTWAKLHPLREVRLPSANARQVNPEYKVEHKGAHRKYCVIRVKDSSVVHEGEQERMGAERWLEGYLRTIGRPVGAPA